MIVQTRSPGKRIDYAGKVSEQVTFETCPLFFIIQLFKSQRL